MNKYEKVKLTKIRQSSNNCLHKCYESNKSAYESINAFVYQSLCESMMNWLSGLVMNVLTDLVMYLLMNEWNESETKKIFKNILRTEKWNRDVFLHIFKKFINQINYKQRMVLK